MRGPLCSENGILGYTNEEIARMKTHSTIAQYRHLDYGFAWGPAEVTRLADDPKAGVVIGIKTPRQSIQIRVTPSGLIRINE